MIKKISALVLSCFAFSLLPTVASAGEVKISPRIERLIARAEAKAAKKGRTSTLAAQCPTVKQARLLVKSEASNHISSGDARATGYTLVCAADCPAGFPATFLYCDGSEAGKLGYYGTFSGNGRPRAYGAAGGAKQHFVSQIARTSKKKGCGNILYLKMRSGANGWCSPFYSVGRSGGV
jgi:hypothetical protein